MSGVRAKFYCWSVNHFSGGDVQVILQPVTSGSEENKSFSKYTPSGKLELSISKDTEAHSFFEPGKEYYLDFTPAE